MDIQRFDEFSPAEHALIVFAFAAKKVPVANFCYQTGLDYPAASFLYSQAAGLMVSYIEAQRLRSAPDSCCEF